MKQLVINADDLGADEARNEGIFAAIRAGTVTSVSLLANGPALRHALAGVRALDGHRFSVGIHLNLSEGTPLASGLRLLTGPDGRFHGKREAAGLLLRAADPELQAEVGREVEAQIRHLEEYGLSLLHLDGHQHVHVLPPALASISHAAVAHGIPWIRVPDETAPRATEDADSAVEREAEDFASTGRKARRALRGLPLRVPDRFLGLRWKGRLSLGVLEHTVRGLPPGLTEVMVHPGRAYDVPEYGPFRAFASQDRQRELDVLLDPALPRMLATLGAELTPFPR